MAQLAVESVKISRILPHESADRLELAMFDEQEYVVVIGKDEFKVGDIAVYFPVDSVLPEKWVNHFNIATFYNKRIRPAKIRGIFSEGLLIPVQKCCFIQPPLESGKNLTDYFEVSKYEPPVPVHMGGQVLRPLKSEECFPSPEHYKKYASLLTEGEDIIVTEKIHGTNFSIFKENGEIRFASHSNIWKDNEVNASNVYVRIGKEYPELLNVPDGVHLYGEIYGIQDLKYGLGNGKIDYRLFGIATFNNSGRRKFIDNNDYIEMSSQNGWKVAPMLYSGEYKIEQLKQLFANLEKQNSLIDKNTLIEGACIVPLSERHSPKIGRICLKYITQRYALRKNGTENK